MFLILLLAGCFRLPPSSWNIFPEPGYVEPGIDFSTYKTLCVLRFENNVLEDAILKKLTRWVAEELKGKHYDVITEKELGIPLDEYRFSWKKQKDSSVLQQLMDDFGLSALVQGRVNQFSVQPVIWRAPGWEIDPRVSEYDVRNTYYISFELEIRDILDGSILWSSSVSCRGGIIKGAPDKLLKRMVSEALQSVPKHH
jgi:hypothetical protein